MKPTPINMIKILSDAKIFLYTARDSNEDVFDFIKIKTLDKKYPVEENDRLSMYDVNKIGTEMELLDKSKDKLNYFTCHVPKEDRRLVLTELVKRGLHKERNLGNFYPLKYFAFIPKCRACGEEQEVDFFEVIENPYYKYGSSPSCHKCGHTQQSYVCKCPSCSKLWGIFTDKLKELSPYLSEGYIFTIDGKYKIESIKDIDAFLCLLKREEIYPSFDFELGT